MKRVFVPILIMAITTLAGLAVLAAEPDYYLRKPIEIEKRDKIKKFWLPDDIIFDPLTGQDPGTDIISSEERILGITRRVRIFPDSSALVSTKYRHKWTKPSKSAIVRARNLVRLHWTTPDLFDHTSTIKLYVRKNKKEDVEFGTWQVVTRSSLDPVPTFDPCDSLEGVALDVYVLSDPVVVTEFEGPLPVWTGNDIFEIGIGGEAPQSATQADPVMIMPDDSFRIGVTSSSTYATTYETRIHIGASSFDYSVTTEGEGGNYADQITPSTPVIPGTQIVSNPFDVQDSGTVEARADDDPDVEFCDNNCENEENWHNNITVDSYTLIKVRAMAPDGYSQRRVIIVKIGNKTAIYELETPEQDVEPDPFDFTDITGVEPNTSVQSDALALTGYDYPLSASITGHGGPQFQVNGGSWGTEAVLHENDTIRLRTTSNTAWEVSNIVSFTAGSRNDLWAVTTRERDITPSAFDFVDPIDHQEPETDVTSNIVTFTGFDGTLDVGVTGDDSARLRINGGNWVTDGQIDTGDAIQLFTTSNATWGASNVIKFKIGYNYDLWTVTTRERDVTPSAFDFVDLIDQFPNIDVTSNIVTFADFDGPLDVDMSGDASSRLRINGGSWVTEGQVDPDDTIQLMLNTGSNQDMTITAILAINNSIDVDWNVGVLGCEPASYTYNTDGITTIDIPFEVAGCTKVRVKAWGAGGGGGGGHRAASPCCCMCGRGGNGGGGAFVMGDFDLNALNDTIEVAVGGAGKRGWHQASQCWGTVYGGAGGVTSGAGGGGKGGGTGGGGENCPYSFGGGGGGASGVKINGSWVAVAGGGGGGSGQHTSSDGPDSNDHGYPGSSTEGAGISNGSNAVIFSWLYNGFYPGDGGGGGGWGGGSTDSGPANQTDIGGGGGGSYVAPEAASVQKLGGSGRNPGGTGIDGYVTNVGKGGGTYCDNVGPYNGYGQGYNGNSGMIVLEFFQ